MVEPRAFTPNRFRVALGLLSGPRTTAQICSEYQLAPTGVEVSQWWSGRAVCRDHHDAGRRVRRFLDGVCVCRRIHASPGTLMAVEFSTEWTRSSRPVSRSVG